MPALIHSTALKIPSRVWIIQSFPYQNPYLYLCPIFDLSLFTLYYLIFREAMFFQYYIEVTSKFKHLSFIYYSLLYFITIKLFTCCIYHETPQPKRKKKKQKTKSQSKSTRILAPPGRPVPSVWHVCNQKKKEKKMEKTYRVNPYMGFMPLPV